MQSRAGLTTREGTGEVENPLSMCWLSGGGGWVDTCSIESRLHVGSFCLSSPQPSITGHQSRLQSMSQGVSQWSRYMIIIIRRLWSIADYASSGLVPGTARRGNPCNFGISGDDRVIETITLN